MPEANTILGFVNLALFAFFSWWLTGVMSKLSTLWDERNEKKNDSNKIASLSEKIEETETALNSFIHKTELHNASLMSKLEELKALVEHKDNNRDVVINGIFKSLERLEGKDK